jgi:hemerythrin-like domain-containing protein
VEDVLVRATDILQREHEVVVPFLDALEAAARRLESRHQASAAPLRPSFFLDASEFMKSFIDECHHRKEEGLLFRALEEAGVPQLGGLMGEVLAEHDECRRLSLQVRAWAERLATGDLGSRAALAWNALAFVRLIRPHMTKEETALFPFADKRLPSALQEELAQQYDRLEAEYEEQELYRRCRNLVRSLHSEARSA